MNLLTLGDSFTYGEELADRNDAWPQVVANKIGYQLVNLGTRGNSNPAMCRQLIDYFARPGNVRPDLVIIGWSSPGRIEFSDASGNFSLWPGYGGGLFKQFEPWREELLRYINQYHNDEYLYEHYLHNVIYVQSFLKNQGIKYLMMDISCNEYYKNVHAKNFKFYDQLIDQDNFIGWSVEGMTEWANVCERGPFGHFLEVGHQRVADKVYEHIRNLGWLS